LKNILLLITVFFLGLNAFSNTLGKHIIDSTLVEDEIRLSQKVAELVEIRFDDAKLDVLATDIVTDFENVLKKQGSFYYPFDSIFSIGKIQSNDGLVRIFTWYAIKADGSHIHFGFIQYLSKAEKEVLLFPLIDKSNEIKELEMASLTNDNWYGATYYEIIESKSQYGQLYVLLGWDGNTIYSNKKVVESLVFTESGRPKFGKPVFVSGRSKVKRIVFEYSRMASMMLTYSTDFQMIVMDHLSPSSPIYNGNKQFYGPDFSYDALKYEDGLWVYYPAINFKPEENNKRSKGNKRRN
jgi:hypothetical protein